MLWLDSLKEPKVNAIIVATVLRKLGFGIWYRSKYIQDPLTKVANPWNHLKEMALTSLLIHTHTPNLHIIPIVPMIRVLCLWTFWRLRL